MSTLAVAALAIKDIPLRAASLSSSAPAIRPMDQVGPVTCKIERCSWRSIGQKALCPLAIIPRLNWSLFWVNRELVVWDYGAERVIHWLTSDTNGKLEDSVGDEKCLRTEIIFDMKPHHPAGGALYVSSIGSKAYCIDLEELENGGRSTLTSATTRFLAAASAKPITEGGAEEEVRPRRSLAVLAAVRNAKCIVPHFNSDGTCILVLIMHDSNLARVYSKSIIPGHALGPFALTAAQQDFDLRGHEGPLIFDARMHPSLRSTLVTNGCDNSFKFWDICQSSANFCSCVKTIRHRSKAQNEHYMYSISENFLFLSNFEYKGNITQLSYETSVQMYSISSANLVYTLFAPPGPNEKIFDLHLLAELRLLLVLHYSGTLNIWRINEPPAGLEGVEIAFLLSFDLFDSYLDGFKYRLISDTIVDSSHVIFAGRNVVYAIDFNTLDGKFSSLDGGRLYPVSGVLGNMAKVMNCLHCKKWLRQEHSSCGSCKRASFCNPTCQISAWKTHRPYCIKATVLILMEQMISSLTA